MDPNIKQMAKLRTELKEGFAS
jgi:hypothetical protein